MAGRWPPERYRSDAPVVAQLVDAVRAAAPNMENPYLPEPPMATYQERLSPLKIGEDLLKIREQISSEWAEDLLLLQLCNKELRRHHGAEVRDLEDMAENEQYQITPRQYDDSGIATSPLRVSTFDLLKTAVTHAAVLRLQAELESEPTQKHAAEWLQAYTRDKGRCFRGGPYELRQGRQFILGMMAQPVSVGVSLGGRPRFVDPLGLAERLMDLREAVATDIATAMEQVPEDHEKLRLETTKVRLLASLNDEP
jgi:hypothetical protein